MNVLTKRSFKYSVCSIFLYFFASAVFADNIMSLSDRKDRWEISLQSQYLDSQTISFDGGAEAAINETWKFGFGIGYNFDEHWALDFDLNWSDVGYSGVRIEDDGSPVNVSGNLYTNNMLFTGIYNFSAKRFTPFIGVSAGWTFVDTNIPTGPPGSVCWWDPWWGYVCSSYVPTKTTTEFTYGTSLGLRFDVKDNVFLRVSAGKSWIDFKKANSTTGFTTFRFDIGLMF
jgi:opacity protein-like surface antigen